MHLPSQKTTQDMDFSWISNYGVTRDEKSALTEYSTVKTNYS